MSDPTQPGPSLFFSGAAFGNGRFTLEKRLGEGGMGIVWLARDQFLGEVVALKFLPSAMQMDAVAVDQMRSETQKSRKLTHPNIVRIFDFHCQAGEPAFISMEYVDGLSLHALRASRDCHIFKWEEIEDWIDQLCDALDYAHEQQIIHRDLKPANILITAAREAKLSDFGIAAAASDTLSRITQHKSSGTPGYMSPQQFEGKAPRASDDIYSFGAVLYELLTSTPPFFRGNVLHQTFNVDPQPLDARLAELDFQNVIPAEVSSLVDRVPEKGTRASTGIIFGNQRVLADPQAKRLQREIAKVSLNFHCMCCSYRAFSLDLHSFTWFQTNNSRGDVGSQNQCVHFIKRRPSQVKAEISRPSQIGTNTVRIWTGHRCHLLSFSSSDCSLRNSFATRRQELVGFERFLAF